MIMYYNIIVQTLEEAKKVPMRCKIPYQQPELSPEVYTENLTIPNDELNVEVIKEELTRENYTTKFHHLLQWEEQEHQRILVQK